MNIGTVYVEIRGNTSKIKGDADQAKTKVVGSLRKGHSEMSSMITNMRRALVAGLAFMVIRGMSQVARQRVDLAIKAEETANLFRESMGNMEKAGTRWVDKTAAGFGLYRADVMKSVGTMNVMLKSMGMTEQQAFDMSTSITKLSIDMASFYNLSVEDAFNKLRAGMVGMSRPLQQLGILVNETAIKDTAMREGIIKTNRELTNREKVLARHLTIMKATITAQGDMVRTFYSSENILRREAAARKEILTATGEELVEPATQASKLGTDVASNTLLRSIGVLTARVFGVWVRAFRVLFGGIQQGALMVEEGAQRILDALSGERDLGGKRMFDAFWTGMFGGERAEGGFKRMLKEQAKMDAEAEARRKIPGTFEYKIQSARDRMRDALGLDPIRGDFITDEDGKRRRLYEQRVGKEGVRLSKRQRESLDLLKTGGARGANRRVPAGMQAGSGGMPQINMFDPVAFDKTLREMERLNKQTEDIVTNTRNVGALR